MKLHPAESDHLPVWLGIMHECSRLPPCTRTHTDFVGGTFQVQMHPGTSDTSGFQPFSSHGKLVRRSNCQGTLSLILTIDTAHHAVGRWLKSSDPLSHVVVAHLRTIHGSLVRHTTLLEICPLGRLLGSNPSLIAFTGTEHSIYTNF